jgi:hypothetical protein
MTKGLLFWVLMIAWLIFGLWTYWPATHGGNYGPVGFNTLLFVLLGLLGWQTFGAAVK